MSFMKDFDHLKIQMKDIVSATNNFDPTNVIGRGGFGRVYKGELSSPEGKTKVAFKQLDRRLGQGNIEFWREVMMLSKYKHENVISLKHFCNEGDEMILVYEYAARGSLDQYLTDASNLTWIQRLKICVGVARGLLFLHDPKETQHRVIHRDVKSSNILLDENWTAKVSDFGLSKVGLANQGNTCMVSHGVGTPGYCDPLYMEFGYLSKESDVYSFGVVLFEVLCGKLCYEYCNRELTKILVPKWRRCYDERRLDEIILPGLREQMDPGSLKTFSDIAYQCVKRAREDRPMMAKVVEELESAAVKQRVGKHGKMGMNVVPLKEITPEEPRVMTLELLKNMDPNDPQNEKSRSQIMIELEYKPFKNDQVPVDGEENVIQKEPKGTPEGGGLLVVIIHQAEDLEGKHHTNPYVRVLFRGEEKKTKLVKKNRDPRWDEVFTFTLEEPPTHDRMHFEVVSVSSRLGLLHPKETLGYVEIPLADVVSNKRINGKYNLIDSRNGKLQVELQWITSS